MSPKLSVILPVYNGETFLREAIDSILQQTFADFELIVINDGSTDESESVVHSFHDRRIRYSTQANRGLRSTLNVGIEASTGEYIARMDQDDISLPDRFRQQIDFLETHPEYILVGTTFAYMNQAGQCTGVFPALLNNEELKREVLTQAPFGHGTVMFRGNTLRKGNFRYSEKAVHVEDYELWLRLSSEGKFANLPDVLYFWRHYSGNTSSQNASLQNSQKKQLQDLAFQSGVAQNTLSWPGWHSLHQYRNETIALQGHALRVDRRNAQSLMYLNLAMLFARHGHVWGAGKAIVYSLVIQPFYLATLLWRRLSRHRENLYYQ